MRPRYLLALLPLAGCAPSLEKLAARCQEYGFTPGTVEMAQCVQAESQAHRAAVSQALDGWANGIQPKSVDVNRGYGW